MDGGHVPRNYRYYRDVMTTYFAIEWETIDKKIISYSIRRDSAEHVPYGASPSCSISVYINGAYRHIYPKSKNTKDWIDYRHKLNIKQLEEAGLKIPYNYFITDLKSKKGGNFPLFIFYKGGKKNE